jgi:hypothetical protein
MTISDFFLKQTKKQIRECCKAIGLDKYRNMPSTIEEWCDTFNLEQDDIIDYFHVIHRTRGSAAEVYVRFVLPNPIYPGCPIIFNSEFDFKTAKGGCTVSFTRILEYHEETSVYKNHLEIFDDRPEYNEVSYDVFFSFLSDVSKFYQYDEYSKIRYILKDESITVWDVYQSVCKFTKAIAPLLNSVSENFKDGTFIKKWNELEPDHKWNTGHEHLKKMYWGFILTAWYRVMITGVKPAFSDYVKIFAAVTLHNKEFGDMVSKDLWILTKFDNSDEEVKTVFNKLISIYE